MKKTAFILIVLAALSGSAYLVYHFARSAPAPVPPPEPGDSLVAEVNGRTITAAVFGEKYKRFTVRFHAPVASTPSAVRELKMGFLNKLIETELLLQQAEMRGLTVSDEELDREIEQLKQDYPKDTLNEALDKIGVKLEEWRQDRAEKLLIDKLIQQEIDSVIHVSADDIQEHYEANREQFQQPLMVRARQIVVATEEEADSLRARIVRGEDFAELAKLHSLSPDAENGGDLGVFAKGQMPEEFDEAVFRYRVGSISKVVHSPYGYHLFKVEERIRPHTLAIEEVQDKIKATIFQKRQEIFFKEWLESLKSQARIVIFPENMEEIF
ncbi:MAG: peptidylprolyl isomerase [bacterium]|nr:peptidylprolyl isomerase [bacterium]